MYKSIHPGGEVSAHEKECPSEGKLRKAQFSLEVSNTGCALESLEELLKKPAVQALSRPPPILEVAQATVNWKHVPP